MVDFGLDAFDDLQKAQDEGIEVLVLKPGTEDVLMRIRVCGPDSKQQARATEKDAEELAARGAVNPLTRQETYDRGTRFLARCCMGWDAKNRNGEEVLFSEDAAFELLSRYKPIREQVDVAVSNRSRFIKRS